MAQKVQVLLVDDIDGGTADETVTFGLDGVTYEIDLTTENATKLRDVLATWVANGRKVTGRTTSRSASRSSAPSRAARSGQAQEIREWAKANGYEVSERGRIPAEVKKAFEDAH